MNSTEKTNLPYVHKNKFSQSQKVARVNLTHKYLFPRKFPPSPLSRTPDNSSFFILMWDKNFLLLRGENYFPWSTEPFLNLSCKNRLLI